METALKRKQMVQQIPICVILSTFITSKHQYLKMKTLIIPALKIFYISFVKLRKTIEKTNGLQSDPPGQVTQVFLNKK